ncbi:hypothetical protein JR316_0002453 [Psilocybe cubensis]|uniref:Uncharacterized protein n=2 Tax=Psilocybe cubensis TaxID=181762 RepID=A0ACB8HC92_PSICU|nr:hypothetical protein JR316_0002453 [Psilocybe cubensis]KAH9485543.1 hypothetical protein JR316_0002453 [Psilocybe cubensis]
MHKPSVDGFNFGKPALPLATSTTVPQAPPAINFATFEFKKIGQPPSLLQRMKDPGPGTNISNESNEESRSPSPDLEGELLISDSTADSKNQGRSLFARIAIPESTTGAIDKMTDDKSTLTRENSDTTIQPTQPNDQNSSGSSVVIERHTANVALNSDLARSSKTPLSSHSGINTIASFSGASSSKHHGHILQLFNISQGSEFSAASIPRNGSSNVDVNADASSTVQPSSRESRVSQPLDASLIDDTPSSSASSGVPLFSDLVNQMNMTLSDYRPINPDVLQLLDSCRAQFTELSSSMQTVSEIAQSLANATQNCVRLLQPFHNRLNTLFSDVEGLDRHKRLFDNVKVISSQMDQRIKIDAQTRCEQERQKIQSGTSNSAGTSCNSFTGPPKPNLTDREQLIAANEQLAAMAARKQAMEEEQQANRRAKEAEMAAELARMDAENAANAERHRAAYETAKRKQEELARMVAQKKFHSLQETQTAPKNQTEENEKREAERASKKALLEEKLAAEREERDRRVRMEQEERKRKEEEEATIARQHAETLEEKIHQDALKEQDKRRQQVSAQKQLALKENAKVAVAQKRNKASQDLASPTKHSNNVAASPYVSQLSVPSNKPIPVNVIPQTAAANSVQVSKGNGMQNLQYRQAPTTMSSNISSKGQPDGPSQPNSTLNNPPIGTGIYVSTIRPSSGLPSPPSEMIQPHSAAMHTLAKDATAGGQGQVKLGSSQIKPPLVHANLPVKPLSLPSAIEHADVSVHKQGYYHPGGLVSPCPQISPMLGDAQKANLARLSEHHGTCSRQQEDDNQDVKKIKPLAKSERGQVPQQPAPTSAALPPSIQTDSLSSIVKTEIPDDIEIPRLSMPSSPSTPKLNVEDNLPTFETTSSGPHASQPVLPSRFPQLSSKISSNVSRQDLPTEASTNASSEAQLVQNQTFKASAIPQMASSQTIRRPIGNNDFFDQPNHRTRSGISSAEALRSTPAEANSLAARRRDTTRAPQNIDHYSPSPSPRPRTPPTRPRQINRRGDHYSPPRSPEFFSGPPRRRSGGGNHSRGVSPVGHGENIRSNNGISMASEPNSQYARKRPRDDQDHGGPPLRRQRADNDRTTERYEIGEHSLVLPQQPDPQREEWSRVANYTPSPSPEPALEPANFNHGRSGYRGSQGRPNVAQRRHPNEHNSALTSNPSNYNNHEYNSIPYQRQNYRESNSDFQPLLLSRFTDQGRTTTPPSEPAQHYPASQHRVARGRSTRHPNPRPNYHHSSLGQRMNTNHKNSLIYRIEQAPPAQE